MQQNAVRSCQAVTTLFQGDMIGIFNCREVDQFDGHDFRKLRREISEWANLWLRKAGFPSCGVDRGGNWKITPSRKATFLIPVNNLTIVSMRRNKSSAEQDGIDLQPLSVNQTIAIPSILQQIWYHKKVQDVSPRKTEVGI